MRATRVALAAVSERGADDQPDADGGSANVGWATLAEGRRRRERGMEAPVRGYE